MKPTDDQHITAMREGGKRLARVLQTVRAAVSPGISTGALNDLAEQGIAAAGATPSFKGYRGYPAALCTSVNAAVVHAIPRHDWILTEGDILGLDLGLIYRGAYLDMAVTVPVGQVAAPAHALIEAARASLRRALAVVRSGAMTGDIGEAVQSSVEAAGFGVVRALVGHGVGRAVHEEPSVPNFGRRGQGVKLRAGQTIAVEPMITAGDPDVRTLADGWTVVTVDGSLAAHVEQTILVTEKGHEVLTPFLWEKSSQ